MFGDKRNDTKTEDDFAFVISVAVWLKIAAELYTKKPASHLVLAVVFFDKIAIQQVDGGGCSMGFIVCKS